MDKLTYLAELAEGLARWVPERERQDILRYYAEYFDEAGPDKEGQVVAELGDPWALSCRLAVEGGYVTQQGADSWTPRQNKRTPFLGAAGGLAGGTRAGGAAGLPRPAGQGRRRVRHQYRGPLVTVIPAPSVPGSAYRSF